jgi:hypothetical protein
VSPVRYELGFYIPEGGILHSHGREILKPYSINRLGSVVERLCVSCDVSTGFLYSRREFFTVTAVKTSDLT